MLISFLGWFVHGQTLDLPAMFGIDFILVGVAIVNTLTSKCGFATLLIPPRGAAGVAGLGALSKTAGH